MNSTTRFDPLSSEYPEAGLSIPDSPIGSSSATIRTGPLSSKHGTHMTVTHETVTHQTVTNKTVAHKTVTYKTVKAVAG